MHVDYSTTTHDMPSQNVIATVHVFHNCARYHCKSANTKIVTQERIETTKRAAEVVHTEPHDSVLNLAQLTNSACLDQFRLSTRYPDLTRELTITKAVETRARRVADAALLAEQKKREQEAKRAKKQAPKNPRKRAAAPLPTIPTSSSNPANPHHDPPIQSNHDIPSKNPRGPPLSSTSGAVPTAPSAPNRECFVSLCIGKMSI